MTKKESSEFGKGFIYNLFLFAKHYEGVHQKLELYEEMRKRAPDLFDEERAVSLWFNAASDHLYEFEIPPKWRRTKIGKLAKRLQNDGLRYRLNDVNKDTFTKFFNDMQKLCRMIDKELGVESVKGNYE